MQTRFTHETVVNLKDAICIFCDQPAGDEGLLHMRLTEQSVRMRWAFKTPVHFAKLAIGE